MSVRPSIRAIVGRFHGFSLPVMEEVLASHPFDHCAIISTGTEPQFFKGLPREKQEWFVSSRVRHCEYAGVDWQSLAPLDEELIEQMRPCETTFIELVSRLEWKRSIPYGVRKRWYLRHLRFWNDYLTRHNINLYVAAWIPHEIPDIVIYELCKLRKIPVVYFGITSVRDTSFVEHDWEVGSTTLGPRYKELLAQYKSDHDPMRIPLAERFAARYLGLVNPEGEVPSIEEQEVDVSYGTAVMRLVRRYPLQSLRYVLAYLTPAGMSRAYRTWSRKRSVAKTRALYDAHVVTPDLNLPYVYLPLSFQPEATTVPQAGGYADLILIAELLHATLPPDVLIYVKEHPRPSSPEKRSPDFYRDFAAIPRVRFMPRGFDTFALREHCRAIATTAGTAGFEGPFRGKPVLLFGHTFYQYAPGTYSIRTIDDCRNAITAIFTEGKKPTLLECRLFLKAIEETCVHGVLDPWCYNVTHLSHEENTKNCSEAIVQALDKVLTR